MIRTLTCIVCPVGCELEVFTDGEIKVFGNSCPRGEKYAKTECTNPTRTVTSTMVCDNGEFVSVKTDKPICKKDIFECMKIINNETARLPISIGDVIIKNVFGSNIIATKNMRGN